MTDERGCAELQKRGQRATSLSDCEATPAQCGYSSRTVLGKFQSFKSSAFQSLETGRRVQRNNKKARRVSGNPLLRHIKLSHGKRIDAVFDRNLYCTSKRCFESTGNRDIRI